MNTSLLGIGSRLWCAVNFSFIDELSSLVYNFLFFSMLDVVITKFLNYKHIKWMLHSTLIKLYYQFYHNHSAVNKPFQLFWGCLGFWDRCLKEDRYVRTYLNFEFGSELYSPNKIHFIRVDHIFPVFPLSRKIYFKKPPKDYVYNKSVLW